MVLGKTPASEGLGKVAPVGVASAITAGRQVRHVPIPVEMLFCLRL